MPPTDNAPTDNTPDQDDQEWADAVDSYSKDRGVEPAAPVNKEDEDGKPNPNKPADPANKPDANAGKPSDQGAKPDADGKVPDAAPKAQVPETPDDPTVRTARQTQRQIEVQEREMREDVRKEMFSDKPTQLLDADGDPISTIEDVQQMRNPNTGVRFTEDEAAAWLLKAQQNLNKQTATDNKEIDRIVSVNLDLHDSADAVKARFGKLLSSMPDVAKKIVTKFNASLKLDPKTGYIVDSPNNMEDYFELALEPYMLQSQQLEALSNQETKRQEDAKRAKDAERKQNRSDRSDIYGGGKVDTMDDEEKEWSDAAKTYYKNR